MCYAHNARTSGFQHGRFGGHAHPGWGRFAKHFGGWPGGSASIPVNIRESQDWYEIFVFAPGLNKDAFQVNVSGDVLTVRSQVENDAATRENWLHREHPQAPFERQFLLNGKVDTDAIAARYTDGVLVLTLPKLPGAAGQNVSVA
ncbi:MAG: Hsp20/alpha crystallin family protein [Saprospiraceae bacterium]